MPNESEPPITLAELIELEALESNARGETRDPARSLRMRLERLRAGQGKRIQTQGASYLTMEARIAALEAEVARLRALVEGGRN